MKDALKLLKFIQIPSLNQDNTWENDGKWMKMIGNHGNLSEPILFISVSLTLFPVLQDSSTVLDNGS